MKTVEDLLGQAAGRRCGEAGLRSLEEMKTEFRNRIRKDSLRPAPWSPWLKAAAVLLAAWLIAWGWTWNRPPETEHPEGPLPRLEYTAGLAWLNQSNFLNGN